MLPLVFCPWRILVAEGWLGLITSSATQVIHENVAIVEVVAQNHRVSLPLPQGSVEVAIAPTSVVAGRIAAEPSVLYAAIGTWLNGLRGRGKRGLDCYRQDVERGMREIPIALPDEVTYDAITGYLSAKVSSGAWMGTTYNRNLSSWRSFTRHLRKAGLLEADPLLDADRASHDGGQGSRAVSIEEARAIVMRAWIRQRADRRSKGDRALYWLCLFAHGCRIEEPSRWQRRHLVLDHEVPHVWWTKDISKNRREQEIALVPELACLLREHLRRMGPGQPNDPVFTVVPSPATFRADRKQSGVQYEDRRGRPCTPHSARKFYSTTMSAEGCPEKYVDFFMRHAGRVENRYFDPSLKEQAIQIARMPLLWPNAAHSAPVDNPAPLGENGRESKNDLTEPPRKPILGTATRCADPRTTQQREQARAKPHLVARLSQSDGPVRVVESLGSVGIGAESSAGVPPKLGTHNADCRTHNGNVTQPDALADLLDAISRLLRNGASGGPQPT